MILIESGLIFSNEVSTAPSLMKFFSWIDRWREVRFEVDQLRKSRNSAARLISEAKKKGDEEEVDAILGKVSNLGSKIEDLEEEAEQLIFKRDSIRMQIPNLLHEGRANRRE